MENQSNISLSTYDLKQMILMEKQLELFRHGKLDLFDLLKNLKGFFNALEYLDINWKDAVQTELNTVEMVLDNIADGSIVRRIDDPEEAITKSISALRSLIQEVLAKYLDFPDLTVLETAILLDKKWFMCPLCTESWESNSNTAMVTCPSCNHPLHNPRYIKKN